MVSLSSEGAQNFFEEGTPLVVQWLSLCAPSAGGMGLIPGQGTKIPHVAWPKKKKNCLRKQMIF